MTDRVYVVATLIAQPGKADDLGQALATLVAQSRSERGCIQYDLHRSIEQRDRFMFFEIWNDERSLEAHNTTDAMKAFGVKTGPMIQSTNLHKYRRI